MLNVGLKRIQPDGDSSKSALAQWGVQIKQEPIVIQARELKPPTVMYKRYVDFHISPSLVLTFSPC